MDLFDGRKWEAGYCLPETILQIRRFCICGLKYSYILVCLFYRFYCNPHGHERRDGFWLSCDLWMWLLTCHAIAALKKAAPSNIVNIFNTPKIQRTDEEALTWRLGSDWPLCSSSILHPVLISLSFVLPFQTKQSHVYFDKSFRWGIPGVTMNV